MYFQKYSADIAFPKISIQLSDSIFDFQIGNLKITNNYFLKFVFQLLI